MSWAVWEEETIEFLKKSKLLRSLNPLFVEDEDMIDMIDMIGMMFIGAKGHAVKRILLMLLSAMSTVCVVHASCHYVSKF